VRSEFIGKREGIAVLCPDEPVAILLTGEMTDDPTDGVHRDEPPLRVVLGDTLQCPDKFSSRKPQLFNSWMNRHDDSLWRSWLASIRRLLNVIGYL
jgi:hypothetical protein